VSCDREEAWRFDVVVRKVEAVLIVLFFSPSINYISLDGKGKRGKKKAKRIIGVRVCGKARRILGLFCFVMFCSVLREVMEYGN
jgi:hypothetical protein